MGRNNNKQENNVTVISLQRKIKTASELVASSIATDGAAVLDYAIQVAGTDGTNAEILRTNSDGRLETNLFVGNTAVSGSNPIPVELYTAGGITIDVDAADLNVQLKHDDGVNYDSVRIGDGTDLLAITAAGAITEENSADILTALQIIDDWDESDRAKVNPIAGQAGVAAGAGAVDALTQRLTIASDDAHFGSVGAASDIDGVVHGQLRFIGEAVDGLETDLTTLAGAIATDDDAMTATPPFMAVGGEYRSSSTTYTDGDATVLQTDENGTLKTAEQSPAWNHYTDGSTLVSAQDLTSSYADYGAEIDVRGYTRLGLFIVMDVNDSEDVDLKFLAKHESGGTDEYEVDGLSEERLWSGSGTDAKKYYEIDVGTVPYIQLQAKAGVVGATAGDLTIVTNKSWRA